MFTFTFFSPKVLLGFLYFSIQRYLGKNRENGTKKGRVGIQDSVADLSFSIPSTHPHRHLDSLRQPPQPFCQRRNFQLELEKKPRNFSKLNNFGLLWPGGAATILLLQKFKDVIGLKHDEEIWMMMMVGRIGWVEVAVGGL